MQIIELYVAASITIFAFGLMVLSLIGYKRSKDTRMIFVSLMFALFLIKGLFFSLSLFLDDFMSLSTLLNFLIFDLIILALLFFSSLKG
jgi:hypothetical protein